MYQWLRGLKAKDAAHASQILDVSFDIDLLAGIRLKIGECGDAIPKMPSSITPVPFPSTHNSQVSATLGQNFIYFSTREQHKPHTAQRQ